MSDRLLCEERCEKCGKPWAEDNRLKTCISSRKLVCENCERSCENHRKRMLPNGTHCMQSFDVESYKYRLLSRPILAPESKVVAAIPKYEAERFTGKLFDRFYLEAYLYGNLTDEALRAEKRIELAAMQRVLRPRILAEPKTKQLYERLNALAIKKVGECGA